MSAGVVEALGGELRLMSQLGQGCRVEFWLPAAGEEPGALPELSPITVLLAEDNFVNQTVVMEILEERGHTVHLAETGRQAVELYQSMAFDLVLMDLEMPEMDGIEATRIIRASEGRRQTPIIALTAHALEEYRERCEQAGMNGFLTKPIFEEALMRAIGRTLAGGA